MRGEVQQAVARLTDPGQAQATVAEQSLKAATIHIAKLSLSDFRSYRNLQLQTEGLPVVLSGLNGAGKTNLLEALSCFSPGRGFSVTVFSFSTTQLPVVFQPVRSFPLNSGRKFSSSACAHDVTTVMATIKMMFLMLAFPEI